MSERMEFNHGNKFDFQSSQALLNEPALGTPGLVPAPAMGTQDRLTHHVHILQMNGDSYRLNQSKRRSRRASSETPEDHPTRA